VDHILRETKPVNIIKSQLIKIILILQSHLRFDVWIYKANKNFVCISYLSHVYFIFSLSYTSWFRHRILLIRWTAKITKSFTAQFFPSSCYFLLQRSKYSSQHCFLQQPQIIFFFRLQINFHTHINNR
jgi:hypothetical protein